ncbi:MAG: hypothetical protein HN975_07495, partial [Anaerolineae bacterium]|nr:hypothetical protein [Anaerolineae bacterium]
MTEHKKVTISSVDGEFNYSMPNKCVYCGGPAEATSAILTSYKRGNRRIRRTWKFPYCNEHIGLQKTYRKRLNMTALFVVLFIVFMFLSATTVGALGDKLDSGFGFVLMLGVGYLGATLVRAFLRKQKVKKNPELADMLASFYLGANVSNYGDQAATFTFTNPQIADEFAASNPG